MEDWDGFLSKEKCLFERDEHENLLPVEVVLKLKDSPKVLVRPMSRGEWLKTIKLSVEEQDKYILEHCLAKPRLSFDEYKSVKPSVMQAIVTAVVALTLDIDDVDVKKDKEELTHAEEVVLKKK